MKKWMQGVATAGIAGAFLGLLLFPQETAEAAREGIDLCFNVMIPSLFPFFALSSLMLSLGGFGGERWLGRVMRPLFGLSGGCAAALVMGFLGGYPVGAKTTLDLYAQGVCSKNEAERLLAFCNNSGSAFVLGVVGTGILGSRRAGWMLYLVHTLASLTVGVLFRKRGQSEDAQNSAAMPVPKGRPAVRFSSALISAVKSAFQSVFYLSAFVIFFTVGIKLLFLTDLLPQAAHGLSLLFGHEALISDLLIGLIEMTSGLWSLGGNTTAHIGGKMALAAFMLGWAGLSVHCQVLSFVGQSGLSTKPYFWGKFLHGGISVLYITLLSRATGLWSEPIGALLVDEVETIAHARFTDTFFVTLPVAAVAAIALLWAQTTKRRL